MNISDEMLAAYLDDELDDATRARVEAALADDRELATRVARQQALRSRLRDAFDGTLHEPLPQRLVDAANSRPVPALTGAPPAPSRRLFNPNWLALAASLVLGLLIGQRMDQDTSATAPIVAGASGPVAHGALDTALTQQLAYEQRADDAVHVGVSFLANSGEYCRTFYLHGDQATAGLACHADNEWQIRMLEATEAAASSPGTMRQAGTAMPDSVRLAVESRIKGNPLDRDDEAQARNAGWKTQ